jgi:hypothetical protein
MKKENLLTAVALSLALLPFYAGAQSAATTSATVAAPTATEAQVFTACSQASIEVRDNSIGSARTTYNAAMASALSARKEAEKEAVALTDASEKKEAIRSAVEEYKKAVTAAQENLTKARKEAWATFEGNTNSCRDISKEARKASAIDKRATTSEKAAESRTMQAESAEVKTEAKSFRESFLEQLESLRNFFKKGTATTTPN